VDSATDIEDMRRNSGAVRGLRLDTLTTYLLNRLRGFRGPLAARALSDGVSTLTYELTDTTTGRAWVLRRPPLTVAASEPVDVRREYQVIRALHQATGSRGEVPVPRPYLLCLDDSVIGAPFYVMARVPGTVYDSREACQLLTPTQAAAISTTLVDTLATLHVMDPRAIGLDDLGRLDGDLDRRLERWETMFSASPNHEAPGMSELAERLRTKIPKSQRTAVVHGDYQLRNIMFPTQRTDKAAALLDWEWAGVGDPLADLGMLLACWEGGGARELPWVGGLTTAPGFHTTDELAAAYAELTGYHLDALGWYVAFAHFKIAVLLDLAGRLHRPATGAGRTLTSRLADTGLHHLDQL
jgi:aminoglycoside phosphotransferase (APT) family kinase protein